MIKTGKSLVLQIRNVAGDWIRKLFTKESSPKFPNPREYWTAGGYEPYTWTPADIEAAITEGWTNIHLHKNDEYPYLKGVVSGNDPEDKGNWYLPKLSHHLPLCAIKIGDIPRPTRITVEFGDEIKEREIEWDGEKGVVKWIDKM